MHMPKKDRSMAMMSGSRDCLPILGTYKGSCISDGTPLIGIETKTPKIRLKHHSDWGNGSNGKR